MAERMVQRALVCAAVYLVGSVVGWLLFALFLSAVLR